MKKQTREDKITICKNQINNIDVIGKVLTQESNLIDQFNKKNNIVSDKSWFERKAKLDSVQSALNLCIKHFIGRQDEIIKQLKLLELPIETNKEIK